VTAPFTEGTRTFACTGWSLSGGDPAAGEAHEGAFALNQDAVLTWQWVAPLITPAVSVDVTMDEDGAPIAWQTPAELAASEPYRSRRERPAVDAEDAFRERQRHGGRHRNRARDLIRADG
jgi:hypothetical protein